MAVLVMSMERRKRQVAFVQRERLENAKKDVWPCWENGRHFGVLQVPESVAVTTRFANSGALGAVCTGTKHAVASCTCTPVGWKRLTVLCFATNSEVAVV